MPRRLYATVAMLPRFLMSFFFFYFRYYTACFDITDLRRRFRRVSCIQCRLLPPCRADTLMFSPSFFAEFRFSRHDAAFRSRLSRCLRRDTPLSYADDTPPCFCCCRHFAAFCFCCHFGACSCCLRLLFDAATPPLAPCHALLCSSLLIVIVLMMPL